MEWYKIHLTEDEIIEGKIFQIQHQFDTLMTKNNYPKGAAMFASMLTEEGETIYFSPASLGFIQDMISQYRGEKTERPRKNEVALLFGRVDDWELLK